jgi:hypothetical protein
MTKLGKEQTMPPSLFATTASIHNCYRTRLEVLSQSLKWLFKEKTLFKGF